MNLKILALLTVVVFVFLVVIGFVFNLPVAYVPDNASNLEFVLYHILFVSVESLVLSALFINMIETSKIDLTDLKNIFKK